jgi:ribosomal protein L37AE/L43A
MLDPDNYEPHLLCPACGDDVNPQRYALGYRLCLSCGDKVAKQKKHTIAPMHKSNYMLFTDLNDLKGINNKGGLYR